MLVIGPASGTLPIRVSVLPLTTSALFVAESKTSTVVLSGDAVMRPGDVPALISEAWANVSVIALMITRPPTAVGLDTLCDAKTRVVSLLGGRLMRGPLLQETKLKLPAMSAADKRAVFFKRQAPNCRKTIDLCAK